MSEEIDISETAKTYLGIETEIYSWQEIDLDLFFFQQELTLKEDCNYGKKGDVIIVDYIFSKGLIEVYNENYDQIDTIKIVGEKK